MIRKSTLPLVAIVIGLCACSGQSTPPPARVMPAQLAINHLKSSRTWPAGTQVVVSDGYTIDNGSTTYVVGIHETVQRSSSGGFVVIDSHGNVSARFPNTAVLHKHTGAITTFILPGHTVPARLKNPLRLEVLK